MFANQAAKTAKTHETKNSRSNFDKNSNKTNQHMDSSNNQVNDKENEAIDDIGNGLEESKQDFQGKNLQTSNSGHEKNKESKIKLTKKMVMSILKTLLTKHLFQI